MGGIEPPGQIGNGVQLATASHEMNATPTAVYRVESRRSWLDVLRGQPARRLLVLLEGKGTPELEAKLNALLDSRCVSEAVVGKLNGTTAVVR